uniref:Exocrine gland-secreting peptide 27 n=1 Tax=Mus musculus TaxID=10090 RepID=A8R0V9_MOUSE|nr:exocrine gland-secreting peptide 27 [Mus musculus]
MASFSVTYFLIILLLTSVVTEKWKLKQSQEVLTTSTDYTDFFIDCQSTEYVSNSVEKIFLDDHKENVLFEYKPNEGQCL